MMRSRIAGCDNLDRLHESGIVAYTVEISKSLFCGQKYSGGKGVERSENSPSRDRKLVDRLLTSAWKTENRVFVNL
jgi:hypothetical protein